MQCLYLNLWYALVKIDVAEYAEIFLVNLFILQALFDFNLIEHTNCIACQSIICVEWILPKRRRKVCNLDLIESAET